MIVLTAEAANAVKAAMTRAGKVEAGLRIMVESGGCAGYKYLIGLDAEPRSDDVVFETAESNCSSIPLRSPSSPA